MRRDETKLVFKVILKLQGIPILANNTINFELRTYCTAPLLIGPGFFIPRSDKGPYL